MCRCCLCRYGMMSSVQGKETRYDEHQSHACHLNIRHFEGGSSSLLQVCQRRHDLDEDPKPPGRRSLD